MLRCLVILRDDWWGFYSYVEGFWGVVVVLWSTKYVVGRIIFALRLDER
jgi:hypothetical protein